VNLNWQGIGIPILLACCFRSPSSCSARSRLRASVRRAKQDVRNVARGNRAARADRLRTDVL